MRLISKKTLLLFFLPGAIFMGAFLIYPIMKMVFDSFFKVGITGDRAFIGLDNYIKAFTAGGFMKQLKNTLVYILIAVSVETILGFIFALLFELNYKGSKIVRSFMMTPLMIAPLVAGLIWKLMMSSNFGIVNEMLMAAWSKRQEWMEPISCRRFFTLKCRESSRFCSLHYLCVSLMQQRHLILSGQ